MAIDGTTLDDLCTSGFGPVRFERRDDDYAASFNGRSVSVRLHGPAVCLRQEVPLGWPPMGPDPEPRQRIAGIAHQLSTSRPELVRVVAEPGVPLSVEMWIDAATASAADVAVAVRNVVLLTDHAVGGLLGLGVAPAPEPMHAPEAAPVAPPTETMSAPPPPPADAPPPPPATTPAISAPVPPAGAAAPPPAPSWQATHRVLHHGIQAWETPDPSRPPITALPAGLEVQVLEHLGQWARVAFSNGWSAWVDAGSLAPR